MPRPLQEINAGSMADIAFLLLIFFLVTTTMNVDTGITRKLPPIDEKPKDDDTQKVKERNVFIVLINSGNQLAIEGELADVSTLKDKVKEFIKNPYDKANLSEKNEKEVTFFGKIKVSKGIVSLQNDRSTAYGVYIEVQNELVAAFNELKNEIAMQKFGQKYEDLDKPRQKAIRKIYPLAISEAEPRNIGGK